MTEATYCRICLDVDVRMFQISDSGVQDVYEKLTNKKIQKGESLHACFICHHQLRKCQQLLVKVRQADELSKQMSVDSELDVKPISFVTRMTYNLINPLAFSRIEYFETPKCINVIKTEKQSENKFDGIIVKDEAEEKIGKEEPDDPHDLDEIIVKDKLDDPHEPDEIIDKDEAEEKIGKEEPDDPHEPDEIIIKEEPDEAGDDGAPTNKTPELDEKHILEQDKDNSIDRGMKVNIVGTETNTEAKENNSSHKICDGKSNQIFIDDNKCLLCHYCGELFYKEALLIKHISEHKPVIFKCQHCSVIFGNREDLKAHVRTHTGEKPFKCQYCNYECANNCVLKAHIRTHTGEKPFKCQYCNFKCAVNSTLKKHIKTHTGEKPFKCQYCNYKCIQNNQLTLHLRTHTGEKPFKCQYCNYECAVNSTLKIHIRTHTGEKPFKCQYCDYKCAESSSLAKHVRIHMGEKPYKCQYCNYKCTVNSALKTHIRTHTGEKPYKCQYCDYKCAESSSLAKHVRIHMGEKPYKCQYCNYKCASNSSLRLHFKTHTGKISKMSIR